MNNFYKIKKWVVVTISNTCIQNMIFTSFISTNGSPDYKKTKIYITEKILLSKRIIQGMLNIFYILCTFLAKVPTDKKDTIGYTNY